MKNSLWSLVDIISPICLIALKHLSLKTSPSCGEFGHIREIIVLINLNSWLYAIGERQYFCTGKPVGSLLYEKIVSNGMVLGTGLLSTLPV